MESSAMSNLTVQSKPYKVTILPNIQQNTTKKLTVVAPVLSGQKTVLRQVKLPICQVTPKPMTTNLRTPCIIPIVNSNNKDKNCNGQEIKLVIGNQQLESGLRLISKSTTQDAPVSLQSSASNSLLQAPLLTLTTQQSQHFGTNNTNIESGTFSPIVTVAPIPQTLVTFTGSIGAISSSKITSECNAATFDSRSKAHPQLGHVASVNKPIIIQKRTMPVKDLTPIRLNCIQTEKIRNNNSELTSGKNIGEQSTSPILSPATKLLDKTIEIVPKGTTVKLTRVSEAIGALPTTTIGPGTIIAKIPFFQLKKFQNLGKRPVIVSNSADKSRSILIRNPVITVQQNPSTMNSKLIQNNTTTTTELVTSISQNSCNSIITTTIPTTTLSNNIPTISNNIISNGTEFKNNEQEKNVSEEMLIHVTPEVTLVRKPRHDVLKANQSNYEEKNFNGIALGITDKSCKTTFSFGGNGNIEECHQQRDQRFQSLSCGQLNNINESLNSISELNERRFSEPTKDVCDNSQSYDIKRLKCTETITSSLEESSVDLLDKNQYLEQSNFVLPQIKKEQEDLEETKPNNNNLDNNSVGIGKYSNIRKNNIESQSTINQQITNEYKKNNLLSEKTCSSKSFNSSTNSIITARSTILCTSIMEINKAIQEEKQLKEAKLSMPDKEPIKDISDSDDDVTFLSPIPESEPIEIDDDDDDDENVNGNQNHQITSNCHQVTLNQEDINLKTKAAINNLNKSDSDNRNNCHINASKKNLPESESFMTTKSVTMSKQSTKTFSKDIEKLCESLGDFSSWEARTISNCGALKWRDRIGVPRGTNLRFQLNEFNLIQLYERCPERNLPYTNYEKPIFERNYTSRNQEDQNPLLYLCRRCNCHGPATDFLAPEFCSLTCLRKNSRKRLRDQKSNMQAKRARKSKPSYNIDNNGECLAAPMTLFKNPIPLTPNNFQIGMKLEAIDPENLSLFCVCTVVDIKGYRIKLSFDGFESMYDFWVNADSPDIFPPGWCALTNRVLQPPKDCNPATFNWYKYLQIEKGVAAPKNLFPHLYKKQVTMNKFQVGMHLEAEDLNDTGKLCVATVADILDHRIRVHFDGWDDCYDIMVDIDSPYIHPCGWHIGRQQLVVPPECENVAFNWSDYIRKHGNGAVASAELFSPRSPNYFRPNMKVEVVDPRNPSLVRRATVVTHKAHRVKLCLDGWSSDHCFWLEDDSCNIHPIGWCEATGHDLEPLPNKKKSTNFVTCPISGCHGLGNALYLDQKTHCSRNCCPYWLDNWRLIPEKPIRLPFEQVVQSTTVPAQIEHEHKEMSISNHRKRFKQQKILDRLNRHDVINNHRDKTNNNSRHITNSLPIAGNSVSIPQKRFVNAEGELTTPELNVAQEFLIDYGPRLQQNYDLWRSHFHINPSKIYCNPLYWTTAETANFVRQLLNCEAAAEAILNEDIDGTALLLLQQSDLMEQLSLKMGPAIKLHSAILQLRIMAVTKFHVPYNCQRKSVRRYSKMNMDE